MFKVLNEQNQTKTDDERRYMPRLHCHVLRMDYDFNTRVGRLWLPPVNCCDMHGCTTMFEAIDPYVKRIDTYAGEEPDTAYFKTDEHCGWRAVL